MSIKPFWSDCALLLVTKLSKYWQNKKKKIVENTKLQTVVLLYVIAEFCKIFVCLFTFHCCPEH